MKRVKGAVIAEAKLALYETPNCLVTMSAGGGVHETNFFNFLSWRLLVRFDLHIPFLNSDEIP